MEDRVVEPLYKLRHLPFFEEIAAHEESDAAWKSATAGLVVLRLVDAWLDEGVGVVTDDGWEVRSVLSAIEDVEDGSPIRTLLGRVVEALQARKPDIHQVITPMMAYARALEYDAKWPLAADVYHSVLAHLHPVEDSDASIAAHLRLGQCYRNLHQLDDAAEAYAAASEIASAVGDVVGVLRARVDEGRLAILRGNLPKAEQILDDAIVRATSEDLRDVRSRALHERSNVAQLRGQYEVAIQLAYDALGHAQSSVSRDRILGDLAGTFVELGVYTAARDAYLVLSATAQEEYVRWGATLNLLEIASHTHSETLFEQHRQQLLGVKLPAFLATGFELNLGLGYKRFGKVEKARTHLERTIAMATEFGINQFIFDAEKALEDLETISPPPRTQQPMSLDVEEVANAIRELRESVGVA